MKIQRYALPVALISAALLTACGGGGGSSPGATMVDGVSKEGATLATADYSAYSGDANLATETDANSAVSASLNPPDDSLISDAASSKAGPSNTLRALLKGIPGQVAGLSSNKSMTTLAGVTETKTGLPCENAGGTYSYTMSIASPNYGLSSGDYMHVTYNNCVHTDTTSGEVATYNGEIGIYIATASDTKFVMTIGARDYGKYVTYPSSDYVHMNGGITLSETDTYTDTSDTEAYRMYGDVFALEHRDTPTGTILGSLLITAFDLRSTDDWMIGRTTSSTDMTLTSPALNGTIKIDTTVDFVEDWYADSYPHTGTLVVSNTLNQKVKLEAIDNTQVNISYDFDADGVYGTPVVKYWTDL